MKDDFLAQLKMINSFDTMKKVRFLFDTMKEMEDEQSFATMKRVEYNK